MSVGSKSSGSAETSEEIRFVTLVDSYGEKVVGFSVVEGRKYRFTPSEFPDVHTVDVHIMLAIYDDRARADLDYGICHEFRTKKDALAGKLVKLPNAGNRPFKVTFGSCF